MVHPPICKRKQAHSISTVVAIVELVVVAAILVEVLTVVAAARVDTIVVVEIVKTKKS